MKVHRKMDWSSIRLPESDSGGKQQHKTEPILSLISVLMVNQNENENEFVLVFGPYNQNGLRFVLQEKVTKMNEFHFRFRFGLP